MRLSFVVLLMVHTAYALTSIQVQNPVQLRKTDIDIRCLVNDSNIESVLIIQLLKFDENIASVRETGVFWQDEELQRRAVADGSVINATSSYLHMTVDKRNVTSSDGGIYSCISSAQYRNRSILSENTGNIFLNITEIKKNDTNDVCGYKASQHSFLLALIGVLINIVM
nr:uncharacterized protein LOC111108048 isoform X2 [Crassostrea virginica]